MGLTTNVRAMGAACLAAAALAATAPAQAAEPAGSRMDIYGFAMLDMGYESEQSDPDWFDVMRPTKLPT